MAASGRYRQAVEYYRLTLQQDPVQPDALRKLAALMGRSAEASEMREKASRMLPHPN